VKGGRRRSRSRPGARIDAVVFDFDGLILDTESAEFRASSEVFERYGCTLSEAEFSEIIGTSWNGFDVLQERATLPLPPREQLRAAYASRIAELHTELEVLAGVTAWIAQAKQAGRHLAIASTSSESWVGGHLDRLGLRDSFDVLSCCGLGAVMPAKPAPDCYVNACAALGVAPSRALAIEDSVTGLAAAKAAGLWCVVVPNPLTRRLDFSAADVQLNSLAEKTLEDVIANLLP
jgi:HAD superfamily hydrolase (TIGR01509 family)